MPIHRGASRADLTQVVRYPVNIDRQQDSNKISMPCGSRSLSPQGITQNLTEMLAPDRLKVTLISPIYSKPVLHRINSNTQLKGSLRESTCKPRTPHNIVQNSCADS